MRQLITIAILFLTIMLRAQPDSGMRSIAIPPVGSGASTLPPVTSSTSIFDNPTVSSGSIEEPELNRNFGKPAEWANPNDSHLERLNKPKGPAENQEAIRKNQYMGDVRTGSGSVRIVYRDHEYPDGDLIKVLVNGQVVKPRIWLDSEFQGFDLTLEQGFNKIDFEALNQGESGPNTAEFQVYDDKGDLISSNRWNLATGFKATVIVVKE